jgi:hypothetical protein
MVIAFGFIGCTVLGTAAMAQTEAQSQSQSQYVPQRQQTAQSQYSEPEYGKTPGTEYTAQPGSPVDDYSERWSRNPGVMNAYTANPNFVEHSHGHP